jgi:hypothetical protein
VSRRRVLAAAIAGVTGGLVLAGAATALTDAGAAQNVAGGVLLGLAGGVGSTVLRGGGPRTSGAEGR